MDVIRILSGFEMSSSLSCVTVPRVARMPLQRVLCWCNDLAPQQHCSCSRHLTTACSFPWEIGKSLLELAVPAADALLPLAVFLSV